MRHINPLPGRCVVCGDPLQGDQIKFCSSKCIKKDMARRYKDANGGPRPTVPSATTGAIHELIVSTDLLKKGFHVFRALSPSCPADLAILLNGKLLCVEVTTGSRTITGKLSHPTKKNPHDILAIVDRLGEIHYSPSIESVMEVRAVERP